ncbi:MAG: signal peptidase II [Rhodothermales bacterium]
MRLLWVSFFLLVVDQLTKQWVHATMLPGESIPILGDVLRLTYTTNPGMAFGLTLGSKLFLTLFSILATVMIGVYLWYVRKGPWGYRLSLALIIGGAVGNVIDRTFYGVFYGYGPLFYGEVVDFIHVDLWRGVVAEWVPFFGGNYLSLFPIWNVADMAIVVGVAAIILFQKRFHEGLVATQTDQPASHPATGGYDGNGRPASADAVPTADAVPAADAAPKPTSDG